MRQQSTAFAFPSSDTTAHSHPHRDIMFQNGRREKLWLAEGLTYNIAMHIAENDINSNWERYRDAFYQGHL